MWGAASLTGSIVYSCTPVTSVATESTYNNYSGDVARKSSTDLVSSAHWEINCCSSNGRMGSNSGSSSKMKLSQGNYSWASAIATAIGKGVDATCVDAAVCTTALANVGKFSFSGGSTSVTNMWLCYSTDDWKTATAVSLTVGTTGEHTFAATIPSAKYAFVYYHTAYTYVTPTFTFHQGVAGTTHTLDKAVSPANSGSVELGATSLVESTGQTTATATANTGYVFNYWTISGAGATMSHTTDGKSTDNPVTVTMGTANATVTANFLQQVKTPTFSEGTGTYNNYKDITLSCETSGATIRYTTNNTEPTSTSTEYTGAITVNATGTVIRAKAFKDGMAASAEASATYTLTCATPALTTGGTFYTNQSVEITCETTDAVVRYTTNGNDPTESSDVYSEAISVTQTTTIKAKAFKTGMNASGVASATYTLKCKAPTFEVEAGTYTGAQTVTISSTTPGVTIRYTTNGNNPSTTSGTVYSEPITVSSSQTVKAIAYKENWSASTVASAAYTIQYYITWNDNGGQIGDAVLVNSGSTNYTCPSDPSLEERGNCGNRFMGWTNTSGYAGDEPPTILFTNSTGTKPAVNGNMDFYAVFADYTKE